MESNIRRQYTLCISICTVKREELFDSILIIVNIKYILSIVMNEKELILSEVFILKIYT